MLKLNADMTFIHQGAVCTGERLIVSGEFHPLRQYQLEWTFHDFLKNEQVGYMECQHSNLSIDRSYYTVLFCTIPEGVHINFLSSLRRYDKYLENKQILSFSTAYTLHVYSK